MFFRPGGRSTQPSGVEANVVIPSLFATDGLGEKTQRYSLPPHQVAPFLSKTANSTRAGGKWQQLSDEILSALSSQSRSRVEASEEFEEIREKTIERQKNDSLMRLADILKDKNKGDSGADEDTEIAALEGETAEGETAEDEEAEVETTPELREAVRVLADLIMLTDPSPLVSRTP